MKAGCETNRRTGMTQMVQYHLQLCDPHDQHLHEQRAHMLTAKCEAEIQFSIQVKEK